MFTNDEKKRLLKTIADLLKEYRGAGPKSHYIKYYEQEIHIVVTGTLSPVEKYLVQTFGQEYIDAVYKFYYLIVQQAIQKMDQVFDGKHQMKLLAWEPDFLNDRVVYRIKYK